MSLREAGEQRASLGSHSPQTENRRTNDDSFGSE
jgi:hypothetical protein